MNSLHIHLPVATFNTPKFSQTILVVVVVVVVDVAVVDVVVVVVVVFITGHNVAFRHKFSNIALST